MSASTQTGQLDRIIGQVDFYFFFACDSKKCIVFIRIEIFIEYRLYNPGLYMYSNCT